MGWAMWHGEEATEGFGYLVWIRTAAVAPGVVCGFRQTRHALSHNNLNNS